MSVRLSRKLNSIGQTQPAKLFAISVRHAAARCRPFIEIGKLDRQNRGLDFIEPKVAADEVMIITRLHSVLPANTDPLRERFVATADHAGAPRRAKIL